MSKSKKLLAIAILLIGIFFVSILFIVFKQFSKLPATNTPNEVVFEIKGGQSLKKISEELARLGVITNASLFEVYARLKFQQSKIKIGEYSLNQNMRPADILEIITSGKSIEKSFTIPEGSNIYDIADSLEKTQSFNKEEFLNLVKDPQLIQELLQEGHISLEGYLFPETYKYTKYTTIKDLIKKMVSNSLNNIAQVNYSNLNLTRHQFVTLASIIEKETGAASERPLISSVFHNRLRLKMRLQTDPTVLYAKILRVGYSDLNITKQDLQTPHPYNTYTEFGLPPGPISNPGLEALKATAQPADTDFLFFVSKNDGTHVFSASYEKHSNAVKNFQQNKKAREGKSWRDLKKSK